jgi:ABC-2 type transport system ATP-binding protein
VDFSESWSLPVTPGRDWNRTEVAQVQDRVKEQDRLDPAEAHRDDALSVESLSHAFGKRRVLHAVSLRVPPGRFCALLGLNGAGKTTLFSLITRLYNSRSGRIAVFGHDVRREPAQALRRLGVVFQNRTLDLELSISQNLAYHAALHGLPAGESQARGAAELRRAGLEGRAGEKVRNLSGGQMRRVEIARALLHRPRLLLLDEPTVGLDIAARADILARVRALAREEGLGVLWATHLIDEIEDGDDVVVLHQGRVLEAGPAQDVIAAAGAANLGAAFAKLTGLAGGTEARDAGDH